MNRKSIAFLAAALVVASAVRAQEQTKPDPGAAERQKGGEFLSKLDAQEGVQKKPSGLRIKIVQPGEGLDAYDHVYTDDLPTIDFMERLVPVFELWRKAGTWGHVHPWMETVLPWETVPHRSRRSFPTSRLRSWWAGTCSSGRRKAPPRARGSSCARQGRT